MKRSRLMAVAIFAVMSSNYNYGYLKLWNKTNNKTVLVKEGERLLKPNKYGMVGPKQSIIMELEDDQPVSVSLIGDDELYQKSPDSVKDIVQPAFVAGSKVYHKITTFHFPPNKNILIELTKEGDRWKVPSFFTAGFRLLKPHITNKDLNAAEQRKEIILSQEHEEFKVIPLDDDEGEIAAGYASMKKGKSKGSKTIPGDEKRMITLAGIKALKKALRSLKIGIISEQAMLLHHAGYSWREFKDYYKDFSTKNTGEIIIVSNKQMRGLITYRSTNNTIIINPFDLLGIREGKEAFAKNYFPTIIKEVKDYLCNSSETKYREQCQKVLHFLNKHVFPEIKNAEI